MQKMSQKNTQNEMKIGFVGVGWVGGSISDNFEKRGYNVIRYSLEPEYIKNKDKIKECDYVFLSLPTPTTKKGFNFSIVNDALKIVGEGKVAIIKSTVLPGTTEKLQKENPEIIILHSPEFLTEKTAEYDAGHPDRNIIGYVEKIGETKAKEVMDLLPVAPYQAIIPAREAEMIKYTGNCWFYMKVVYMNLIYDLCTKLGIDFEIVKKGLSYDPRVGFTHLDVVHQGGRGAGGHCFIKDFAALRELYSVENSDDITGNMLLALIESKNVELLKSTGKSTHLLKDILN